MCLYDMILYILIFSIRYCVIYFILLYYTTKLIRHHMDNIYVNQLIIKTNKMKTLTNILPLIFITTLITLITYNVIINGIIQYISFNGI